jgi:hypothetical protein
MDERSNSRASVGDHASCGALPLVKGDGCRADGEIGRKPSES